MYGWLEYLAVAGVLAVVVGLFWHMNRTGSAFLISAKGRLWDTHSSKK
jgi:hypothetical protein